MKILITLALLSLTSCAVHHHHHYPDTPQTSAESGHGNTDEELYADEQYYDVNDVEEPDSPAVAYPEHMTDEEAEPLTHQPKYPQHEPDETRTANQPSVPSILQDCDIENFETGWVVARCGSVELFVQTGPAARGSYYELSNFAATYATMVTNQETAYWGKRSALVVNGVRGESTEYQFRATKPGPFGGSTVDKDGEVIAHGVFTIAKTKHGKAGMLCMTYGSQDKASCQRYFNALGQDLKELGRKNGPVMVGGVALRSEGKCHFLRPRELACSNGSLTWQSGSLRVLENLVETTIAKWTDDHGIAGFYNPHLVTTCTIAGKTTTCHEVRFQGVMSTPAEIRHATILEHESLAVMCTYSTQESAPLPCTKFFGKS